MKQTTTLSTDLLRRLALMQHLGEDFFIVNGIAYEGTKEDARNEFNPICDNGAEISFSTWCEDNLTVIDELDIDDCYEVDYLVCTDEEADEKWEESLDSYIEECIQPEIDKIAQNQGNLSYYIKFDEEAWKHDARDDGRGHSLSSYNGCENEEIVEYEEDGETYDSETFYIYRIN